MQRECYWFQSIQDNNAIIFKRWPYDQVDSQGIGSSHVLSDHENIIKRYMWHEWLWKWLHGWSKQTQFTGNHRNTTMHDFNTNTKYLPRSVTTIFQVKQNIIECFIQWENGLKVFFLTAIFISVHLDKVTFFERKIFTFSKFLKRNKCQFHWKLKKKSKNIRSFF